MPYPGPAIFPAPNVGGLSTSRPAVLIGMAEWFGGTFDLNSRSYRGGVLTSYGLGAVRAGYGKEIDMKDAFEGSAAGRMSGALMVVDIGNDQEIRQGNAGAPVTDGSGNIIAGGIKQINYQVTLEVFHISQEAYAEDAQADVDQLIEAIKMRIRVDRTLGGICMDAGETRVGLKVLKRHAAQDAKKRTLNHISFMFEVRVNFIA